MKRLKRFFSLLLVMALTLCCVTPLLPTAKAAGSGLTLAQLQEKFPQGKYWNHVGLSYNNADGYTSSPCPDHSTTATCNAFTQGAMTGWQCFGFAMKLAYDAYGTDPYKWGRAYNLDNIKPGDIINQDSNSGHSIFVIGVSGDTISYADCNSDYHCVIRWDRTKSKSAITVYNVYVAPYALDGITHVHNYAIIESEALHPHKEYAKCSCGDWYYTGNTVYVASCADCNACSHSLTYVAAVEATCTEPGVLEHWHCTKCGKNYIDDAGKVQTLYTQTMENGHKYNWSVTFPTCTEQGYRTYVCSVCQYSFVGDYTDSLGHAYTDVVTAPTCTEQGYTTHTCSRCNDSYIDSYVNALGHTYAAGTCTRCGAADPDGESPDDTAATISIGNTRGRAGETVTVPICMENNPGVISVVLDVSYDPARLQLISAENTGLLNGTLVTSPDGSIPYALSWTDGTGSNNTGSGVIANLTFEILQTCEDGTVPITVAYDPENVFDENFDNVTFAISDGAVEVISVIPGDVNSDGTVNAKDVALLQRYVAHWDVEIELAAADVNGDGSVNAKDVALLQRYVAHWDVSLQSRSARRALFSLPLMRTALPTADETQPASISFGSAEGNVGDTITVPVTISNNPGVISVVLDLTYDAQKVKLVGVENTGLLTGSFTKSPDGAIPYALTWIDGTGADNTSSGVIANLTFEILEDCKNGGADITMSYDPSNIFNSDFNNVVFALQNGKITVKAEAHAHQMTHVPAAEATCTQPGNLEYWNCVECGKYYLDVDGNRETTLGAVTVAALGHNYAEIVTPPTCTEKGYTTHTCTRCGDSFVDTYVDALGHNYTEAVTAPTCTEKGYTTHTCARCGDSFVDTYVDALGHDLVSHEGKNANCEDVGWTAYDTCSRCDYSTYVEIPALGHIPGEIVIENKIEATETENGSYDEVIYCTVCGKELQRTTKIINKPRPDTPVIPIFPVVRPVEDKLPFRDVKKADWYYDEVKYVFEHSLMNGTGNNMFNPNATTTRGMIVTILYRLENEPDVTGRCRFSDVRSGSYYEKAIIWAAENGIVNGYGDATFRPDDEITREQLAAILYRYAQFKGYNVYTAQTELNYRDAYQISGYATRAMQWASKVGLICGNGISLMPREHATRAQVAAILHRFCEKVAK